MTYGLEGRCSIQLSYERITIAVCFLFQTMFVYLALLNGAKTQTFRTVYQFLGLSSTIHRRRYFLFLHCWPFFGG